MLYNSTIGPKFDLNDLKKKLYIHNTLKIQLLSSSCYVLETLVASEGPFGPKADFAHYTASGTDGWPAGWTDGQRI